MPKARLPQGKSARALTCLPWLRRGDVGNENDYCPKSLACLKLCKGFFFF